MTDLAQRRADRQRVMRMIYEMADGSRLNWIWGQDLLDATGMPDDELGDICEYLAAERMIEGRQTLWGHATFYMMRLLHRGIKDMESTASQPAEPATDDALDLDIEFARGILRLFESSGEAIDLRPEDKNQLAAEMRTVKAQVESPRPDHKSIRRHMETARRILIGATGSTAAAALIEAINLLLHIH